uniref:WD repeat protein 12 n=1 Tax=Schistosoma japonicum TaxID=6182 RepID=C1LIJ8_SCHJA|nr:WD repeat protein 12 [Schistosoma japonicum]
MDQTVQITFYTKFKQYSVSSAPISVPRQTTVQELNNLVKVLLDESGECKRCPEFTFLVNDLILTSTLHEYLSENEVTAETINIEFCPKQEPPKYEKEYVQDDLISCVKRLDKYILTGGYDGTLHIWSLDSKNPVLSVELEEKVKCVEWISLNQTKSEAVFVTGGFDQTAQIWHWDLNSSKADCIAVCRGHCETVMTAAARFSNNSNAHATHFAKGSWDATIKLWSAGTEPTDLSEETGGIIHVRKSTSKTPTRIPLFTLAGHRETITRICWLPSTLTNDSEKCGGSQLLSVSWDHSIRIWDCEAAKGNTNAEVRCILSNHALHDADVNSRGILTASSDNCIRIYDPRAEAPLVLSGFQGHTGWLTSVAWAPHKNDQFVSGSIDRSVRLWDTRNPRASLYDLMGHADMVTDVDWAPAIQLYTNSDKLMHYILSSSADSTIKVYHYPE